MLGVTDVAGVMRTKLRVIRQAEPSAVFRTRLRSVPRRLLYLIAILGVISQVFITWKTWQADRHLASIIGTLGQVVGDVREQQQAYSQALGRALGDIREQQQAYHQALGRALGEFREQQQAYNQALGRALGDVREQQQAYNQALGRALDDVREQQASYNQALGQALGDMRNEWQRSWPAIGGALKDIDVSSRSFAENLVALGSRLGIRHNPRDIDISSLDDYDELDQNWKSFRDKSGRRKMPCEAAKDTAVIVTLGQSNAANHSVMPYTPKHEVLNFNIYDGSCYRARDPLLGTSGSGGNFATPLSDMLIDARLYNRVILAPIAMGGTTVEQWADEGRFNRRILVLIRRLFDSHLTPTYILWHQGEGNRGEGDSGGLQYRKRLLEVVSTFRRYGISAPFFVALATKCGEYPRPNGENIREGQRATINPLMNVFLGPDTDTLGDEYRDAQHCHFNAAGLERHAAMWADVLKAWIASKQAWP